MNREAWWAAVHGFPNQTINTHADLVGDAGFEVQSLGLNFSKQYIGAVSRRFLFHPAINAASSDVSLAFTYKELRTPDGNTVPRRMEWKEGTFQMMNWLPIISMYR